jgi:hypothetical protein
MCDTCIELDKKIEHFQTLADRVLDPQTVDGLKKLIKKLQAQKAALHPCGLLRLFGRKEEALVAVSAAVVRTP